MISIALTDDLVGFFSGGVEWRQQHQGMPLLQKINNIEWAYRELKSSSSPFPDGVPVELLKTACK